jgi:sigma-E factor negative regulatory protein RseC
MIEQQARVKRVFDGMAELEVRHEEGCASCSLRGGCGMGSLGRLFGERKRSLMIPAEGLEAADRVVLGLPENQLVGAGLILYLTPLLGLFVFALIGSVLSGGSDGWSTLAGLFGLFAGIGLARLLARRRETRPRLLRRS